MAGRAAPPLPELFDLVAGQVVAGEVQHAVEQHASVPARQDEPIAIGPVRLCGGMSQMTLPEHVRERRQRHRGARMARLRLLHRIHRERADGVYAELLEGGLRHSRPDLAACQSLVSRSNPSTSMSTCCGLGLAWAATLSSSTRRGISLRPCLAPSLSIRSRIPRIFLRTPSSLGTCHKYSAAAFPSAQSWPRASMRGWREGRGSGIGVDNVTRCHFSRPRLACEVP